MSLPGPWFAAAYYGTCAGCGDDIEPDDLIRGDGEDGYWCEGCGQEEGTAVTEPAVLRGNLKLVAWGPDMESVFPGCSGGNLADEEDEGHD